MRDNFMDRFYRLIRNFGIAIALLCFFASPAYPSTISHPMSGGDFFKLGLQNILQGNYQQAIQDMTQAIQLKSNFAAAYSNRCLAELQIKEYQNAIADCNNAIHFAPNNVEAYLNRGLAYYRQGNYQNAIADDNQAIALKPHDFRAYYNRGVASAMLGNYRQAIGDYNLALSQIPQFLSHQVADIYNDRGLARVELQDLQAAMQDFSRAIRINSHDERAYFNRGCVCGKHGDHLGAIRDFSTVIELNPSSGQAYVNRGLAYHLLGYQHAAITDLQQASTFFIHQGQKLAYEKTLSLLKMMQQDISSELEVAFAF
jgi:tetratricopeptide (TPR) repeat protein